MPQRPLQALQRCPFSFYSRALNHFGFGPSEKACLRLRRSRTIHPKPSCLSGPLVFQAIEERQVRGVAEPVWSHTFNFTQYLHAFRISFRHEPMKTGVRHKTYKSRPQRRVL